MQYVFELQKIIRVLGSWFGSFTIISTIFQFELNNWRVIIRVYALCNEELFKLGWNLVHSGIQTRDPKWGLRKMLH